MHLIRRFFGFLTAAPLTPTEQVEVHGRLDSRLAQAFFSQRFEDQRHAFEVHRKVTGDEHLHEAALLHDIGKAGSDLGAISRACCTVWSRFGLRTSGRWNDYLNHGLIGADELERLGAGRLAVAFARHHPGTPPFHVDAAAWQLLESADEQ